jgi:hypothetical protein
MVYRALTFVNTSGYGLQDILPFEHDWLASSPRNAQNHIWPIQAYRIYRTLSAIYGIKKRTKQKEPYGSKQ